MDRDRIKQFQQMVDDSERIVFFGGAGVSTESGIPDFRSPDGLYNQQYAYPPETILSYTFYQQHKDIFFQFYRSRCLFPQAAPNQCHRKLAEMEEKGKLSGVITQNIDGLHQKAGSQKVVELHGSVERNYCEVCGKFYPLAFMLADPDSIKIPRCTCGGPVKPDVVLYEEALDGDTIGEAVALLRQGDMLIIGGTSLTVYPAAGFIQEFRGKYLVIINRTPTNQDQNAALALPYPIGAVMETLQIP